MTESEQAGLRLLVLDGGDIRCLSQLTILEEFLHQVQWSRKSDKVLLPCVYFHMICATGPAGIIVILLVVFRMSIQETKDEFVRIWRAVFADDCCEPAKRSSKLEEIILNLLKQRNMPLDSNLLHSRKDEGCKVFVCAISPEAPTACQKFRNYASSQCHIDVSIVEAVRATCAAQNRFTPVKIRRSGANRTVAAKAADHDAQEFVAGDSILQNPTQEAIKELCEVYGGNRWVSCMLSLGCGRPGVIHLDDLNKLPRNGLSLTAILQSERAADELETQLGGGGAYYRFSVDRGLESSNDISMSNLGIIETHTRSYLQQATTRDALYECSAVGELPGRIPINDIFRAKMSTPPKIYGLPPLCTSFVTRQDLLNSMDCALFKSERDSQRIMVLSGMGGSGKTQMVTHFADVYSFRFNFILFIDASSEERIEQDLIYGVQFLGEPCKTFDSALRFLDHPDHFARSYLLILDNADNPQLELESFLPRRGYGYTVITTRNPTHGDLAPKSHIRVDIMSEGEALDVLLLTAFSSPASVTDEDRRDALLVIQDLDYLPVAIVQAGSYIKRQSRGRVKDYLTKLKAHRQVLLSIPAKAQRDRHHHAVYATLDVTLDVLSNPAKELLGILSCFNYTGFPLPLVDRASAHKFIYEPFKLFDRGPDFQEMAQLLTKILDPPDLPDLNVLAELEQFSLVVRVENHSVTTLRFHPLTHSWMSDRIAAQDKKKFWDAAMRLLVCGMSEEDEDLFEYLHPQLTALSPTQNKAHWNDLAATTRLNMWVGERATAVTFWTNANLQAIQIYGETHLRPTVAKLQLAMAHDSSSSWFTQQAALKMIEEVIAIRSQALSFHHPDTLEARNLLSEVKTMGSSWISDEDLIQQLDIVTQLQLHSTQENPLLALKSKEVLAKMYQSQAEWRAAEELLLEVVRAREQVHGMNHLITLRTKQLLAQLYFEQNNHVDTEAGSDTELGSDTESVSSAKELQEEVVAARIRSQGPKHVDTLRAQHTLAEFYERAGQNDLAEATWRQIIEGHKVEKGPRGLQVLDSMKRFANLLERLGRYEEAMQQHCQFVEAHKMIGNNHRAYEAMQSMAKMLETIGKLDDAIVSWEQLIEASKATGDSLVAYEATELLLELLVKMGKHGDARALWKQHIAECQAKGSQLEAREGMKSISELFEKMGGQDDAVAWWEDLIAASKATGNNSEIVKAVGSLAGIFETIGRREVVITQWEQLVQYFTTKGIRQEAIYAMRSLAQLHEKWGEEDAANRWEKTIVEFQAKGDGQEAGQAMELLAEPLKRIRRSDDEVARWGQRMKEYKAEGDSPKAAQAMESLATLLERIGRNNDAVARLEQRIEEYKAEGDSRKAAQAMMSLAKRLERIGRKADAVAQWEQWMEEWKANGDSWHAAQAMESLANLLETMNNDDAVTRWEQWIEEWKVNGDSQRATQAMESLAKLLETMGRNDDAVTRWEQWIEEWKANGDSQRATQAMESLAKLLETMGRNDDTVARWEKWIEGWKANGDSWRAAQAMESLAKLLETMGRNDDAVARWEQWIKEWKAKGDSWQAVQAMESLAVLLEGIGRNDDAVARWEQLIEEWKAKGYSWQAVQAMESLTVLLERIGRNDDAVTRWEQWIKEWKAKGDSWQAIQAMESLAVLLERIGRNADAVARWEQWIMEWKAEGDSRQAVQAMESLAVLLERIGRNADAVAQWEQLIEEWKAKGNSWQAVQAMESLAVLLERIGRNDDAVAQWEQLIEEWKAKGYSWRAVQAMESLAVLLERIGRNADAVA